MRVEHEARGVVCFAIDSIAYNWVIDALAMHADLVRAPGFYDDL